MSRPITAKSPLVNSQMSGQDELLLDRPSSLADRPSRRPNSVDGSASQPRRIAFLPSVDTSPDMNALIATIITSKGRPRQWLRTKGMSGGLRLVEPPAEAGVLGETASARAPDEGTANRVAVKRPVHAVPGLQKRNEAERLVGQTAERVPLRLPPGRRALPRPVRRPRRRRRPGRSSDGSAGSARHDAVGHEQVRRATVTHALRRPRSLRPGPGLRPRRTRASRWRPEPRVPGARPD